MTKGIYNELVRSLSLQILKLDELNTFLTYILDDLDMRCDRKILRFSTAIAKLDLLVSLSGTK